METEEKAKAQIDSIVEQEKNAQIGKTKTEQLEDEVRNIQLAMLEMIERGI